MNARLVAEDANRAKDDFIAVLAHELRSPLASVTLSAEILKRLGAQNEIAASSLGIINRQAAQLRRLVDDMLDLARMTHGKLALQCRPLDLLALVQNIDLASLNTSGRAVVFDVSGTPVWVNADAARVLRCHASLRPRHRTKTHLKRSTGQRPAFSWSMIKSMCGKACACCWS